jgi:hypothetical protein
VQGHDAGGCDYVTPPSSIIARLSDLVNRRNYIYPIDYFQCGMQTIR